MKIFVSISVVNTVYTSVYCTVYQPILCLPTTPECEDIIYRDNNCLEVAKYVSMLVCYYVSIVFYSILVC